MKNIDFNDNSIKTSISHCNLLCTIPHDCTQTHVSYCTNIRVCVIVISKTVLKGFAKDYKARCLQCNSIVTEYNNKPPNAIHY